MTTHTAVSCPILDDLPASGPHPDLVDKLMLFGQFVGVWDLRVQFYDDDGRSLFDQPGTWSFGWVLDGRAIQDVLVYPAFGDPPASGPGTRGIGTSVRYFNPRTDTWHVSWFGVVSGTLVILQGGRVGDEIHLTSEPEPDGTLNHWMFTAVSPDGFVWKGYESADEGTTWRLRQRMQATRRPAPA